MEQLTSNQQPAGGAGKQPQSFAGAGAKEIPEGLIEIVSDSGEGAQTAGQMLGTLAAKMGLGVWTVEIIPAEIEPPPRSKEGASGVRIRMGTRPITNMGDEADLVVAFNEQVLYSRIDNDALRAGTVLLINDAWGTSDDPKIREDYAAAVADFRERRYDVREVPMTAETLKHTDNPRRGQNMWVVGMVCAYYSMDVDLAYDEVTTIFTKRKKGQKVIDMNHALIRGGYEWGLANFPQRFQVRVDPPKKARIVTNGNAAIALGAMAAGFEVCSMYPITPATSCTHYMAGVFHKVGGFIHQAEDEIAAVGFAIGASYAGKTALTITSGPGMALKTEMIGMAVMCEIPLVVVDVQRGGPSTGLPTKVEQGDLLHAIFAHPGDAPKIVMAPSTIEECFHFMVTARKLSEAFRMPVIVLTDANLGTGQCPFDYPDPQEEWLSPPVDQSPWTEGLRPYDWDKETGLSRRAIPGMKGGQHVLTSLAHNEYSRIAYASAANQHGMTMRSKKLAAVKRSLKPPKIFGPPDGDLLVVGWGSTRGAMEEAVERLQKEGKRVSALHLRFLTPFEPGLKDILRRFKRVMTIEINYSDEPGAGEGRRTSQLATLLRAETLVDVDCWSRVPGQPLPPGWMENAMRDRLQGVV